MKEAIVSFTIEDMEALILFPHQLFDDLHFQGTLIMIEDPYFFDGFLPFHKHKLMLHRASMKYYYDVYQGVKRYVEYHEYSSLPTILKDFTIIYGYDPVESVLQHKYTSYPIQWLESPNFMTTRSQVLTFFENRKRYHMHDFYVFQRQRLNILMEDGKPLGGKYSFDTDNRQKLPAQVVVPSSLPPAWSTYEKEAAEWVDSKFPHHMGSTATFHHAIHRQQALDQLHYFIEHKLSLFGPYQDAIDLRDDTLFHSDLSSSLNIGLLSPSEIVNAIIDAPIPLSSKEGYVRQIIGWREYVRALYLFEEKKMKSTNFLHHTQPLPASFSEGIHLLPIVDGVLEKIRRTAYSHHIERLMVLGNLMLLLNIAPTEVYRFFMISHIDAYDWVMVANVFGMSQFASGSLLTTKPYFSSSNYLIKMGVPKGPWSSYWDALFYLFIRDHQQMIEANPRLTVLVKNLARKSPAEIARYEQLKRELIHLLQHPNNEIMGWI